MSILQNFDLRNWIGSMLILIVAITIHEFAHAVAATRAGDDTPRQQGRLSLNPIDHLDPVGTVMMAISSATGLGIGWGRPVQYNPAALRHPRGDSIRIALWGPISNLLQALVLAVVLRVAVHVPGLHLADAVTELLVMAIQINIALAFFNLIPIPPLDGSKVLAGLLPLAQAQIYERAMTSLGLILFAVLIFTGLGGRLLGPPVDFVFRFLAG